MKTVRDSICTSSDGAVGCERLRLRGGVEGVERVVVWRLLVSLDLASSLSWLSKLA